MTITIPRFIELTITTRKVSVSDDNDRKNKNARTNIHI